VHSPLHPNPIKSEFIAPSGRRVSRAARIFDLNTGTRAAAERRQDLQTGTDQLCPNCRADVIAAGNSGG